MGSIILELKHRRAIAERGEAVYPLECRGLLLGRRNGIVKHIVDILFSDETSQPESGENSFHISSEEMQEGEEIARAKELEVLGSFHSTINRPAKPSSDDRQNGQPNLTYLIVGVRDGRAHELIAWTLSEDRTSFFQEDFRTSSATTG
jgi:proteasome lid subunit RPN8/RPN11